MAIGISPRVHPLFARFIRESCSDLGRGHGAFRDPQAVPLQPGKLQDNHLRPQCLWKVMPEGALDAVLSQNHGGTLGTTEV